MTDPTGALNAERVEDIFKRCLAQDEHQGVVTRGVVHKAAFDAEAVKENKQAIREMLAELPDSFRKSVDGGMSFLNACDDRHGSQWTGFHLRMEQLFMLGMAAGLVTELLPRDMWQALPGGMPYYVIDL